jgi:hypothetical protein
MKFLIFISLLFSLNGQDQASITRGQKLYDSICFSCHGKTLEGGVGFNLKDAEWIHGGTAEKIKHSIKTGFPEKGMLSFAAIYKDEQINDLTNFILSRQEGLRDLSYKIFHNVKLEDKIDWENTKPNKSGVSKPAFVNLNLPEVDQFAMSYKGKLVIPAHKAGESRLMGGLKQSNGFEIFIDGKKLDLVFEKRNRFVHKLKLAAGTHDFELRYIKTFRFSDIALSLSNKGSMPLSIDSYRKSIYSQHIVKADEGKFQIIRKRIKGYDSGSIAVNHANKITYIINPGTAAITAIWSDNTIDIGPNINGRGQHEALPLGKSIFNATESLSLKIDNKPANLTYSGYSSYPTPKFMFKQGNTKITISSSLNPKGLLFTYTVSPQKNANISLLMPKNLNILSADGALTKNKFTPSPDKASKFEILVPLKEKK